MITLTPYIIVFLVAWTVIGLALSLALIPEAWQR
jgi:hypothetical protein